MKTLLVIIAVTCFGIWYVPRELERQRIVIEMAELDVQYAQLAVEHHKRIIERYHRLQINVIPQAHVAQAQLAYDESLIELQQAEKRLEWTKTTKQYMRK